MLGRLPPHRFVQCTHGHTVTYVYADPLLCDCLYLGSRQAYRQYRLHMQQQDSADEQDLTAEMYSAPDWNWGASGQWGPGYGFGGGFASGTLEATSDPTRQPTYRLCAA